MNKKWAHIFVIMLMVASSAYSDNDSQQPPAVTSTSTEVKEDTGKMIFEIRCAACHGNDGTAGIGNAANLAISKLDSATIVNTILNGKAGMPSFKDKLTALEIVKVEHYVYGLRK